MPTAEGRRRRSDEGNEKETVPYISLIRGEGEKRLRSVNKWLLLFILLIAFLYLYMKCTTHIKQSSERGDILSNYDHVIPIYLLFSVQVQNATIYLSRV